MAKEKTKLTPMMQQFFDLKAKHPDALLLFRCGDFYETYCDDATEAARILGITLTRRNNGAAAGDAMAGFPYHALDNYLPRLIRAGKRVAICDQLEDPKKTKTLVKRGITELVTPGVTMQDNVLEQKQNNFLAAVSIGKTSIGVALLDISTGEFMCGEGSYDYVIKVLDNFQPKEVLFDRTRRAEFFAHFPARLCTYEMDDWVFTLQTAQQLLCRHFSVKSMKGYGVDHMKNGMTAAGAILQYMEITQHTHLQHITSLSRLDSDRYVRMDAFTLRSLEILSPMTPEGTSLLSVLDRTATAMGGRMLRRWLTFPLKDVKHITQRQNIVEYFFRNPEFRMLVDEQLHRIADLERIASKVSTMRVSPREMRQMMQALEACSIIKYSCMHTDVADLRLMADDIDQCQDITQRIKREIDADPPLLTAKGGMIADGVNEQLDELRQIRSGGKQYLLKIQTDEAERTGIQSLKIGFNNVFGYYLEVRNTYKDLVPEQWIRKQTLANAERYITPELKEYEEKILTAEERIISLEQEIYERLVLDCQPYIAAIQRNAQLIAQLDCLLSMAITAEEHRYIRPIVNDSMTLNIKAGRHPVIETELPVGETYIPNDIALTAGNSGSSNNSKDSCASSSSSDESPANCKTPPAIIIITGPNMAGKSALLRQTALITLMAQVGSFVPADSAEIGIVDRIFTRVGASDNIAHGESTFMVEMTEASNILNNITPRSLVLFDELGRGTSTYDGISIAWAIVQHLHESCAPRTLFATHYHELNDMADLFPRIENRNVSVREHEGRIIFLRKLEAGGSEHSFGIHVAKLAGMPKTIVARAEEVLSILEEKSARSAAQSSLSETIKSNAPAVPEADSQLSFFQLDDPILTHLRDQLLNLDVNNLTPLQALNTLNDIKQSLGV